MKKSILFLISILLVTLLSSCIYSERNESLKNHQTQMKKYLDDKYGYDFTVHKANNTGALLDGLGGGGTLIADAEITLDGKTIEFTVDIDIDIDASQGDNFVYRDQFLNAYYKEDAIKDIQRIVKEYSEDFFVFNITTTDIEIFEQDYGQLPSYAQLIEDVKNKKRNFLQKIWIRTFDNEQIDTDELSEILFNMTNEIVECNKEGRTVNFRLLNEMSEPYVFIAYDEQNNPYYQLNSEGESKDYGKLVIASINMNKMGHRPYTIESIYEEINEEIERFRNK